MEFSWSKYPTFQSPENRRRLILLGALGLVLLVIAGSLTMLWRSEYLQKRSLQASSEYFAAGDVRSALLMLQQTVQLYPDNLNARRMLAEYYLAIGSPAAVSAWREVAEREPGNDENLMSLAEAALGFGDESTVQQALAGISPEGRGLAAYHRILAGLALRQKNEGALRMELAELERLEPENLRLKYNRAAVDVMSSDPIRATAARNLLEEMARGQTERIRATLQLLQLTRGANQFVEQRELARRILPDAPATPERLLAAFAAHMKSQSAPTPEDAAELMRWMAAHGSPDEALTWAANLPVTTATARPVALARAALAIQAKNWSELQSALRGGAWGPVRPDLLDSAFTAQTRRSGSDTEAMHAWDLAVAQATGSLQGLRFLDNLAIALNWPTARDRVLWRMSRDFPRETGAWRILALGAEAKGDSAGLADIYRAWLAAEPGNPAIEASQAILAVIRGEVPTEVRTWLGQVAIQPGAAVELVAAWAWLEAKEGRQSPALARLDAVQERISGSVRACLFYGSLLAEGGRRAEARLYLSRAEGQPRLLPEERAMLVQARRLAGAGI